MAALRVALLTLLAAAAPQLAFASAEDAATCSGTGPSSAACSALRRQAPGVLLIQKKVSASAHQPAVVESVVTDAEGAPGVAVPAAHAEHLTVATAGHATVAAAAASHGVRIIPARSPEAEGLSGVRIIPARLPEAEGADLVQARDPEVEAAGTAQTPELSDEEVEGPLKALSVNGHGEPLGWPTSGQTVGNGWCRGEVPVPSWSLHDQCVRNGAALDVRVLSYNLFWWNLFGQRHGNGGSAGRLIAGASAPEKFDVMGFQECENAAWVLGDAGLSNSYALVGGNHAVVVAYRKSKWNLLASGQEDIAEDAQVPGQYYGRRGVVWVRLQHWQTGKTLFFLNHHGPLPVGTGGACGGEATAFNILRVIGHHANREDLVVVVGDFNAGPGAAVVQTLRSRINEVFTGNSFGGVDHIFSSCTSVAAARNLGSGGSDHDAIMAVIQF